MIRALLLSFFASGVLFGAGEKLTKRIGGDYIVESIKKTDDGFFEIRFVSAKKTGAFDHLLLHSDHIHFSVKEGQSLRISAEILKENRQETSTISQVLLFLPHAQGYVPVWMLSRYNRSSGLEGSRYIEMHAPQSDYTIF